MFAVLPSLCFLGGLLFLRRLLGGLLGGLLLGDFLLGHYLFSFTLTTEWCFLYVLY